jgi:hypothetical protein
MDVTILEFDLDDAQFNAPFAGGGSEDEDGDDEPAAASGGGFDFRPVAVIAVLVGLAVLAKYLRSGDGVEVEVDDGIEIEEA